MWQICLFLDPTRYLYLLYRFIVQHIQVTVWWSWLYKYTYLPIRKIPHHSSSVNSGGGKGTCQPASNWWSQKISRYLNHWWNCLTETTFLCEVGYIYPCVVKTHIISFFLFFLIIPFKLYHTWISEPFIARSKTNAAHKASSNLPKRFVTLTRFFLAEDFPWCFVFSL